MRSRDTENSRTVEPIIDPIEPIPPSVEAAEVGEVAGVWTVSGRVAHGDRRGRLLGFPTANLHLDADTGVRDGVWAAQVAVAGETWVAAVSIGHRPTFYGRGGERLLEAHLLDFNRDLYDQRVTVSLREHLRPQRTFPNSVDLVRQMHADLARVREWARLQHRTVRDSGRGGGREPSVQRDPERIVAERRVRHDRLIEAAAQDAASSGVPLDHDGVASRAGLPPGFLRWAYPSVEDLQRASLRGARAHRGA